MAVGTMSVVIHAVVGGSVSGTEAASSVIGTTPVVGVSVDAGNVGKIVRSVEEWHQATIFRWDGEH